MIDTNNQDNDDDRHIDSAIVCISHREIVDTMCKCSLDR